MRRGGGVSHDEGRSVCVFGNAVFTTGKIVAVANFNTPFNSSTNNITSAGTSDIYLAKYSTSGGLLFLHRAGGTSADGGLAIKVNENEIYLGGNFNGIANFNTPSNFSNNTIISKGLTDAYLSKYSQARITGNVYFDLNKSCIRENEIGNKHKLYITPSNTYIETNELGYWESDYLPIGDYKIFFDSTNNWKSLCANFQQFSIANEDDVVQLEDFGITNTNPCEIPAVSLHMPFIRRGFSNQKIYAQACNDYSATGVLNAAYTDVELDELLTVESASMAYTGLGNNIFRFQHGNLNPGQCASFWISTTVSMDAVLNQTLCMEASLYPADSCVFDATSSEPADGISPCTLPWDKSSIQVDGWCENDSIYFAITNTGDFGDGDMQCYSAIRLFIDGQYLWLDSILLVGGGVDTLVFSGDGRTWRLEVDQHPLHPGNSHPNATVELCGNDENWTPDLVNILPMDDADPVVDIYCGIVTGSYDPNDKTGYPLGVGTNHKIMPNGEIEYLIRFQNTGTDTAFTVIIRDTLDTDFNIFSVQSGVSSHEYDFTMHGPRVLEWTFNNILLPDSSTDQEGSNGFVKFTVDQNPNLPDGTEFNNKVGIYFDFNEPVITNTTSHIIDRGIKTKPNNISKNISLSNCEEVSVNGIAYKNSGSYFQLLDGGINQDTLLVVEANVIPSSFSQTTVSNCYDFAWTDGNTYTESGTYSQMLINAASCDSLATLELVILESTTSTSNISECESFMWTDGNTYSESGTYSQLLTNAAGCDSLATLELVILNSTTSTTNISECESFMWTDGNTYTESGTYSQTLTNLVGCDSLATLELLILGSTASTTNISECESFMWTDGNNYTESGTYSQMLTNVVGCDSLATLELVILESTASTTNISECESFVWTDGNTYTESGTYSQTLTNVAGCDSISTLELTILESTASTTNVSECESYMWTDGNTYTESGTYSQTLTNAAGCDSVATLELVILETTASTTNISECESFVWTDGNTYTESGTYSQTLTNAAGCDSIATLELVILENTSSTTNVSECEGYIWTDGNTYTESGIYSQTLTNAAGCDSVATLELVILESTASTTNISECESYMWTDGNTYTESGTYSQMLTNSAGCDSIATLELVINENNSSTTTISACDGYLWTDGNNYTSSGTYSQTLSNANSCDSVAWLELTIHNSAVSNTSISSCENFVWTNGNTYTNSGTYYQILTTSEGCDSIATLQLTILEESSSLSAVSACESYTWTDGNTYTSTGVYIQNFLNAAGCDSTSTLVLSVGLDTSITVNGSTLSSSVAADSYQWLNCADNFAAVSGANAAAFIPTETGIYALSLEINNCSDTSSCYYVYINSDEELKDAYSLKAIPNPTSEKVNLISNSSLNGAQVVVFNTLGGKVFAKTLLTSSAEIDLSQLSSGVYFIQVKQEKAERYLRVVKE